MTHEQEIIEAFEELERFAVCRDWAASPLNEYPEDATRMVPLWNEKIAEARKKILKLVNPRIEVTA